MRFSDLENVTVAILGAGREGQAVWRQIRQRFPSKPLHLFAESELDHGFLQTLDPLIDTYHIAPLHFDSLEQFDVLVRSAGISPYRQALEQLRAAGKVFTTASSLWFAENPDAKTICITGTMGKSTTAKLTAHLLDHAGVKICLAGNIGQHMLDSDGSDIDWWVIELSSYQLSDLQARPNIAVLLNLSEEHVDWHGGVECYSTDKLKLVDLTVDGCVIANFCNGVLNNKLADRPGICWFNHESTWRACKDGVVAGDGKLVSMPPTLPGAHNKENLAAALTVIDVLGFQVDDLEAALLSFRGLPHRQQFIGEQSGIRYINDSISTTPVSVAAALETFGTEDVVLLLGGMDRGLDWTDFANQLAQQSPYAIITLPDNGSKIVECFRLAGVMPKGGLHTVSKLSDAVELAQTLVPRPGCVLLSPGAPSFPHFQDYADRGKQFEELAAIENND